MGLQPKEILPKAVRRLSYRSFSFQGEDDGVHLLVADITTSRSGAVTNTGAGNHTTTASSRHRHRGSRKRSRRDISGHYGSDSNSNSDSNTDTCGGSLSAIFLALGVGVLLPWNAYIMAKPYFASRLATEHCDYDFGFDASSNNDVLTADSMEAWFSVLFNGGSVLSLAVLISLQFCCYGNSTVRIKSNSNWYLVMVPLAIYLIVFLGTTLLVLVPNVPWLLFAAFTFGGFTICGVCTSIASAGIVSAACRFHNEHVGIHPYFNGQAVGGLLVALGNFVANYWEGRATKSSGQAEHRRLEEDPTSISCHDLSEYSMISWPTVAYFAISSLILAACMVGYSYVDQHLDRDLVVEDDDESYSIEDEDNDNDNGVRTNEATPLLELSIAQDEDWDSPGFYYYSKANKKASKALEDTSSTSSETNSTASTLEESPSSDELDDEEDLEDPPLPYSKNKISPDLLGNLTIRVIQAIWGPALSLFWTFFVTLAIFPVWTSELSSIHSGDDNDHTNSLLLGRRIATDLFTPMTFVVFNAGDLLGRMVSSVDSSSWTLFQSSSSSASSGSGLVGASLLRFAFFVLFLFCHSDHHATSTATWEIQSDAYSWILQLLLAITNGYLTNVAFCLAPTLVMAKVAVAVAQDEKSSPVVVVEAEAQQIASAVLNFAMSLGLLCGSFASFYYLELAKSI